MLCTHTCGREAVPGGGRDTPIPNCFSPQDLAWAISYYARFFITYIPFYGVLGAIIFLNFIRCLRFAG